MTTSDLTLQAGDCLVVDSGRVLLFTAHERNGALGRRTFLAEFRAPAALILPELPDDERWVLSPDIGAKAHREVDDVDAALRNGLDALLEQLSPVFATLVALLENPIHIAADSEISLRAGDVAITDSPAYLTVLSGTVEVNDAELNHGLLPTNSHVHSHADCTLRLTKPSEATDLAEAVAATISSALDVRHADSLLADQQSTLSAFESASNQQKSLERTLNNLAEDVTHERSTDEPELDDADPYWAALVRVAMAAGFTPAQVPGGLGQREGADAVLALANASGAFVRRITLRGDWYRTLLDPAFGFTAAGEPVALVPTLGGVDAVSVSGERTRVSPETIDNLARTAFVFSPEGNSPSAVKALFSSSARVSRLPLIGMIIWGLVLSFVTLVVPLSANTLFNEIIPNGDAPRLLWLFGVLLVVAVATLPLQVAFAASVSEVVNRSSHHHMRSLWSRIMRVPSDYVAALGRGEVVSRFVDLALVAQLVERQVLTNTPVMIAGAVALIAIVVVAPAPGLVIAILLAIILALGMMMTRRIDREQQRVSEGTAEMRSFLLTVFGALAKVRVTAAELIVFQRWTTLFRRVVGADLEKTQSRLSIFTTVLPALGTFVLIAAVSLVGLTTVDAGAFVALQYLVGVVVAGGVMLIFATIALQQQLPVLRRVLELSDSPLERGPGSGQDPGMLRGAIDLVGVSFTYPGTGRAILDDVTLSIQPGESVAIVGPSGSGKSTLLRLLLGFETPTNGVVLYDGRDMRNLDVLAVRRQLGVVLQDSALDSGQIRKNVSGPRRMRDPEIWAVLEAAAVADDIRAMPMRLETPLTFGGGGISGGQRQRLLIARALATQPRILVLDEATSALDNRAQATISSNLDSMGITRLIVAHRLSTIRNADRIIVLDAGRIAQEGSYEELMADETGIFSRFARRQMV